MLSHPNAIAIEASQLYCYAISLLIKGTSPSETLTLIKNEIKSDEIKSWFKNEIETKDKSKMTSTNSDKPLLKIPFVWAFFFLYN